MQDVVESMMAMSRYGSPGSSIYPETPRPSPLLVPSSTSGATVRRLFLQTISLVIFLIVHQPLRPTVSVSIYESLVPFKSNIFIHHTTPLRNENEYNT